MGGLLFITKICVDICDVSGVGPCCDANGIRKRNWSSINQRGVCVQFRYALLSLAALEVPLQLELNGRLYGQDCVFIANDWHASLVPVYLAGEKPHSARTNPQCCQ